MNIQEFCERFKISMRKAREMEKLEVLRLDPIGPDNVADIRGYLLRRNPLTAMMLIRLIEMPALIDAIGGEPERRVKEILSGLDGATPAPREVSAGIVQAAFNEPAEIARLCAWLRSVIPARPVNHSYIAVRLLLGLPANMRQKMVKPINSALGHARRSPEFAGWSRVERTAGRNATIYQKPLDL